MPYVGDDYLTTREYKALREKFKAANTPTPWKRWAAHYLSPAGKRDRELVQAREEYETKTAALAYAQAEAQRAAMDKELPSSETGIRQADQNYAT